MVHGRPLPELATEIQRRAENKRDFRVPTNELMIPPLTDGNLHLHFNTGTPDESLDVGINDLAHRQMQQHFQIHADYYNRLRSSAPDLLRENLNYWMSHAPKGAPRLVRCLDGNMRAFLSGGYRMIDNEFIAEAVIPILGELGCQIGSAEITEKRLYIQAFTDKVQGEVRPGDIVRAGVTISNSEVGLGYAEVDSMILRLACLNGATTSEGIRKRHVGSRNSEIWGELRDDDFSDETKKISDKALFLQIRDTVKRAFDSSRFDMRLRQMRATGEVKLLQDPVSTMEITRKKLNLSENESKSALTHLASGGDLTIWGLSNSITAVANESTDYDRAVELQRIGWDIIQMQAKDFVLNAN